jgi:hypothetical protein
MSTRTFYVSAENTMGVLGLDLTLEYDPSNLEVLDVRPVDQASGYSAVWRDYYGTLQIAFYGYAPLRNGGRLVEITVQSTGRGPIVLPRLSQAHANEEMRFRRDSSRTPARARGTRPARVPGLVRTQPVAGFRSTLGNRRPRGLRPA